MARANRKEKENIQQKGAQQHPFLCNAIPKMLGDLFKGFPIPLMLFECIEGGKTWRNTTQHMRAAFIIHSFSKQFACLLSCCNAGVCCGCCAVSRCHHARIASAVSLAVSFMQKKLYFFVCYPPALIMFDFSYIFCLQFYIINTHTYTVS